MGSKSPLNIAWADSEAGTVARSRGRSIRDILLGAGEIKSKAVRDVRLPWCSSQSRSRPKVSDTIIIAIAICSLCITDENEQTRVRNIF